MRNSETVITLEQSPLVSPSIHVEPKGIQSNEDQGNQDQSLNNLGISAVYCLTPFIAHWVLVETEHISI